MSGATPSDLTIPDTPARIEAILRGEHKPVAVEATPIPSWYGGTSTGAAAKWLEMWERMKPNDEAFYQSNAIGWASR